MILLLTLLACTTTTIYETPPVVPGTWTDRDPTPTLHVSPDAETPQILALNEVQTLNESTVMDADFDFPDWVEILNLSDAPVDLSRVSLSNIDGETWTGTEGTIPAHDRVLLYADPAGETGQIPFFLSWVDEKITLSLDGVPQDRLATGEMMGDTAWARFPDGGDWKITARPTPGFTNGNAPPSYTDPSDALFRGDTIHDVYLTIPPDSWTSLGVDPYTYVPGSFSFEGAFFPMVGIHQKGQIGSYRALTQKAAFKVKLDKYIDGRLRGLGTLTFNNMVQDPTCMHEYLAYTLYRELGIPSPRVGYTHLYVNNEYWGLYLWVESANDDLLARWFADPDGNLYEGSYGTDFYVGDEWAFEQDEGPDDNDRSDITRVAEILDGTPDDATIAALETVVDLDEFILEMAVEVNILHWDGYTTSNNYRIYHDPVSDRFSMLPWGTDQTFHDKWYGLYAGYGRVFTFCMANAACTARYEEAVIQVADVMDSLDLVTTMDALHEVIADDIASDPRKESSMSTFDSYARTTRGIIENWPTNLREALGAAK